MKDDVQQSFFLAETLKLIGRIGAHRRSLPCGSAAGTGQQRTVISTTTEFKGTSQSAVDRRLGRQGSARVSGRIGYCMYGFVRCLDMGRCTVGILALALLSAVSGVAPAEATVAAAEEIQFRKQCPPKDGEEPPPGRVDSSKQLAELRRLMAEPSHDLGLPLEAYIITSNDEHMSEYPAAWDRRREYVSGFTGSNGVAVVTATRAALWTDGRYVLQADDQLDCNWDLMVHEWNSQVADWLSQELPRNAIVGVDPRLISQHAWDVLHRQLDAVGISLVEVSKNLVDIIWTSGRPKLRSFDVFLHNESFSGTVWMKKVELVRDKLKSLEADAMVVTSLEEVAWLFNIRGYDIQYTPVVKAYAIISMKEIYLFINESKLTYEVNRTLRTNNCFNEVCIRVRSYTDILRKLKIFSQQCNKILLPAPCVYDQGVSRAVYTAVHPPKKRFLHMSPILLLKAKKNNVEIHGMRAAHIRDAVAFCDFMAYFEKKLEDGVIWDEIEAAREIDRFRGEQRHSKGPSFTTIAGYGPNGALPHYVPTEATNLIIGNSSTFVLDSGGQYLDGTTDVTRTLHFGTPTEFEKEVYTRVLMGSIQLAALVFPIHVKMSDVDVLARGPLWEAGLDYDHGTGHGIGSFLSVHESPISIAGGNFTFEKGFYFSDEPGYYEEGQFGVRLENILEVEERPTKHNPGEIFYGFRPVTLIPYEPKLINVVMLNKDQRDWLNDYNSQIRQKVGAELKRQKRMKGFRWMMKKTGYIPDHCSVGSTIFGVNTTTRHILLLLFLLFLQ